MTKELADPAGQAAGAWPVGRTESAAGASPVGRTESAQ